MTSFDAAEVTVALVPAPNAGEPADVRPYVVEAGGSPLGRAWARTDGGSLRINAEPDVVAVSPEVRRGLLRAFDQLARLDGLATVVVPPNAHPLLRHEARMAGFTGPLRRDLVPGEAKTPGGSLEDRFLTEVGELLPGTNVSFAQPPGGLRSIVRSASRRVEGAVNVVAEREGIKPLRVLMPLRNDVMPESVALLLDTGLSVRHCFRPAVDRVRVFVDQSGPGLKYSKWAGHADQMVRDIHISQSYTRTGAMEVMEEGLRLRRQKGSRESISGLPSKPVARSYGGTPPYTRIDAVVAHEFWHQIEFDIDSGRYTQGVGMRAAVGHYFGVDTLEHVMKGGAESAPLPWRQAYVRLGQEVSLYATTSPKEALAEIFSVWWCTPFNPPPVAIAFQSVLKQMFPNSDLHHP